MTRASMRALGDFFRIKHGYAFKGEFFSDSGEHILLTPGNFSADSGLKLKGEKEKFYTGPVPPDFVLSQGDLIVAMTDLTQNAPILGAPAIVPESGRYLHNQRLGKIVELDEEELDKRYLYYVFQSADVRAQIKATATGATVRHTAPERIYAVRHGIPPVERQRLVASILGAYDDLIENNRRRIAILEEMARAVYREWFVELRFPGRSRVPPRWESVALSDAVLVNPRTVVPREGLKPFVPMSGLDHSSMHVAPGEMRAGNSGSKFKNGDTLFARITPCIENGKTGFVQFLASDDDAAFGSTEFIVLRGKLFSPEMVYLLARTDELRAHAINSMSGATGRQRVRESCFTTFRIALPPAELVERFTDMVRPMFRAIHTLGKKNDVLRTTRELLLPRLLSGELDVSNVSSAGEDS
jgi:type I restriction enzyme, S subunit